ncbi:hypothetical protein Q31a_62240 [Aureliella helgolandensis]|uniref:Uncharacterized protein n=1 Tax=Aureliella helgolandensis TaxID=2527968 RepID=A0A518GGW2_9BACT|nr:hypothetical protein Q31a_62240 [Aureliella helgolandensis]
MLPGVLYSSRAWMAKMVEGLDRILQPPLIAPAAAILADPLKMVEGLDQVLPPPLIASAAAILADPLNDQAVAASSEAVAPRDFLSKQG